MFIDASALTALLTNEDDAQNLLMRLTASNVRLTSPLAVWEAVIAVSRILDMPIETASKAMNEYLALMVIQIVSVPPEVGPVAIEAFERFGKGRHPARLNFGDCFAYACASHYRVPLLFKGADFAQTDIEQA